MMVLLKGLRSEPAFVGLDEFLWIAALPFPLPTSPSFLLCHSPPSPHPLSFSSRVAAIDVIFRMPLDAHPSLSSIDCCGVLTRIFLGLSAELEGLTALSLQSV